MIFVDAAPHRALFPLCRAVVHHGGAGTTHEGLRWGLPSIILPLLVDQPFWGKVVAEHGAGAMPCRLNKLTKEKLAASLREVLKPEVSARAEALGRQIRTERGAAHAADLIEDTRARFGA